ncbi:hypothetical protein KY290_033975 [Solanum tuberosum]|uniref:Legumain prodomain domain-containing protein n=1 Tax=Solanum tuberosum TaxID=4113 RepID=A0ABQ7U1W5_SOLTU|nr:hypothetical protein KY289_033353 [Solanum tuberosum]KAH0649321.1 hypothetical protein KY285_034569 [Solanum tuberosum]KAH0740932.1 hypothetical protein KY290_033975 [Solanum tuberosum]
MFVKINVASFLVALFVVLVEGSNVIESIVEDHEHSIGTQWAVLVAGSSDWYNYRHQADICHAYQLLKKGGLKDEHIIVFMYDDIAYNSENPRRGVIINNPHGQDVYKGVPKCFNWRRGKVVNSGPNDHIFIYYADHGGPGVIDMPIEPSIYAKDLNEVLKKKHASRTYKKMVFYMEACDSGSMFDGLLNEGLNIYVTTASKPDEDSWATYCSFSGEPCLGECPPKGFNNTCLGDLFSVSWLENSDLQDRRVETLEKQYQRRDVQLLYLLSKFQDAPEGSTRKSEAYRKLSEAISEREHVDKSVKYIGQILFGVKNGPKVLNIVRPAGQPLVDDWDCLKSFVKIFESHCGSLTRYGRKHVRGFANMCNAGIQRDQMDAAAKQTCSS